MENYIRKQHHKDLYLIELIIPTLFFFYVVGGSQNKFLCEGRRLNSTDFNWMVLRLVGITRCPIDLKTFWRWRKKVRFENKLKYRHLRDSGCWTSCCWSRFQKHLQRLIENREAKSTSAETRHEHFEPIRAQHVGS